jgi:hypothetical protein
MATKAQIVRAVDAHLAVATAAGKARHKRGDVALSVAYEPHLRRLRVELASGVTVIVPVSKVQGLANAKPAVVRAVELAGKGYGLYWPDLDLDVSVPDLVAGCFGNKAWMAALARQAGRKTSGAKAAAARKNGAKGGRPRKAPRLDAPTAALA